MTAVRAVLRALLPLLLVASVLYGVARQPPAAGSDSFSTETRR